MVREPIGAVRRRWPCDDLDAARFRVVKPSLYRHAARTRRLRLFGRQPREEMMAYDYSQYGGVLVARQDKVLTMALVQIARSDRLR